MEIIARFREGGRHTTQCILIQLVASEEHQVSARYPADTQYCWSALEEQLLVRHMKAGHSKAKPNNTAKLNKTNEDLWDQVQVPNYVQRRAEGVGARKGGGGGEWGPLCHPTTTLLSPCRDTRLRYHSITQP